MYNGNLIYFAGSSLYEMISIHFYVTQHVIDAPEEITRYHWECVCFGTRV